MIPPPRRADLKFRMSILTDRTIEMFNGVNGTAAAVDGTHWKIRTWADFTIVDGEPQGDPAEFQSVNIQQIGRRKDNPMGWRTR